MPNELTEEQKTKIKATLAEYHDKMLAILKQHHSDILNAIQELDKQKVQELDKLIESFN
ncbi:MAG: hypothetical protein WC641_07755 [Patescibacteria group bacterium]